MTVATQETHIEYAGDNSSTVFALDFPFVDATCLKAVKIDGNGVSTPVTITDTTGGSQRTGWGVTISAPVGTGYTLRIYRDTPMIQPKVYTENDPFPGRSHEIGLDRLTMIVQELRNALATGTFSGNPVTFIEGDELTITPILERGQIGFATDSRVLLLKLQDGTVVRFPIDSGDGSLAGYAEGHHSESSWLNKYDNILGNSNFIRGENNFLGQAFLDGATLVMNWFGVLPGLASPGAFIEASFGGQNCGQFSVEPASTGDHSIDYQVKIFCTSVSGGSMNLRIESSIRYSKNYAQPAAALVEHTRVYDASGIAADDELAFTLSVYRYDAGYIGGDLQQYGFSAYFINLLTGAQAGDSQLIGDAGGDLSGTYPNPTVVGIRGEAVPSLTAGFLSYTGTEWAFTPLSAFDFVKRPGDSMTGKLEFKDGEGDEEPGSIEKTVGMGFNYLDIQQAGINANINISTEDNAGSMTEKISIGPNGVDLKELIYVRDELALGSSASFLTPYIDFRNQAEPGQVQSRTFWDADNLTLTTMLRDSGGPDTKLQHGQEIMIPCFNDSGVAIPSFRAVYISGSQGDKLKVDLADPTDPAKTQVIGVTTEEIPDQAVGFVTFFGEVRNEDTTAFTDGQEGFLSSAGGIIGTSVADGDTRVRIGYCRRSHASTGSFFVAPMRYPRIEDVTIDVWKDQQLLGVAKTGVSAPTFAQFGATNFWKWRMAAGNIFYADAQANHDWNLRAIQPHIHFSSDNGGTGDFRIDAIVMSKPPASGTWSAQTLASKIWSGTLAAGEGAVLALYDGDGYEPPNPDASTLFAFSITMATKSFTGNIFIDGWDFHYGVNRLGTDTAF